MHRFWMPIHTSSLRISPPENNFSSCSSFWVKGGSVALCALYLYLYLTYIYTYIPYLLIYTYMLYDVLHYYECRQCQPLESSCDRTFPWLSFVCMIVMLCLVFVCAHNLIDFKVFQRRIFYSKEFTLNTVI